MPANAVVRARTNEHTKEEAAAVKSNNKEVSKQKSIIINILDQNIEIKSICPAIGYCLAPRIESEIAEIVTTLKKLPCLVNLKNIYSDLANDFLALLESAIVIYVNRDLEEYCRQQNIRAPRLTTNQAIEKFEIYFKKRHGGEKAPELWQNLAEKHTGFEPLMQRLMHNYKRHTISLIQRMQRKFVGLREHFLQEFDEKITLIHIKSMGSDRHQFGKSVYGLVFQDGSDQQKTVIYKPSPLTASALLVGDISRLKALDSSFKDYQSFLEIFNDALKEQDYVPLPTYLIWPCQDTEDQIIEVNSEDHEGKGKGKEIEIGVKQQTKKIDNTHDEMNSLDKQYGFMEFISYQPWETPDYQQLVEEALKLSQPQQRITNSKFQKDIDEHFNKLLRLAAKAKKCDFIAQTHKELEQYSMDCGVLLAFIALTGLTDMHCENLILHERRPVLIDTEICFNPQSLDPKETVCFKPGCGSMRVEATSKKEISCLFDISGEQTKRIEYPERNRMYFYDRKKGMLNAYQPDQELFLRGYQLGLEVIAKKRADIAAMANKSKLQHAIVRIIPFSTQEFVQQIEHLVQRDFNKKDFCKNNLGLIHSFSKQEYEQPSSSGYLSSLFTRLQLPNFEVYSPSSRSYIARELATLSVPCFWGKVNSQRLFTSEGGVVFVNERDPNFFPVTLQQALLTRLQKMTMFKGEVLAYIKSNLPELLQSYYKVEPVAAREQSTPVITERTPLIWHLPSRQRPQLSRQQSADPNENNRYECCQCRTM